MPMAQPSPHFASEETSSARTDELQLSLLMGRDKKARRVLATLTLSWQAVLFHGLTCYPHQLGRQTRPWLSRLSLRLCADQGSAGASDSRDYNHQPIIHAYDEDDDNNGVFLSQQDDSAAPFGRMDISTIDASNVTEINSTAAAARYPAANLQRESVFSDYNLWRVSSRFSTLRSGMLILVLIVGIFSAAYALFPGSFVYHENSGQYLNSAERISNGNADSMLDFPEYSESGGVVFSEDEVPMAKTTVIVH